MRCEVCGREAKLIRAEIEGAELLVCSKCASLGKPLYKPEGKSKLFARKDYPKIEEPFTLIENYGEVIRKAREKKGLTREELAKKLFEKESVLQRIEANKLEPSDALVLKLEKVLGITLREQ
ncbi:MAG: TIGR00270 family protein [Candidatus Diapherotrites archaeon]|uniref:TIGR00270 family protein n=1 Tax=Candidatus Iainarchaeum sp. TaxID=3101447 RepID=A0A497JGH4_9ARCH|nr:TIGR00270 family protein [Candidatus Diapherotrites archaeon]RLG68969.1 MAG: TIGR00270 family protein [Candidatus Diapherotrites archaeon]